MDLGKFILRIGVSALMMTHGYGKLERLLEKGTDAGFANPFGIGEFPTLLLAVLAEFICPILIIIGWKTRWASIFPILTMLTAAFVIHIDDPWSKMEPSLLYLTGFLAIALLGAGRWSVDRG